ncbi:glycerophosphodiester phosphodiesterase family protein [Mariluticola halotolerans]|uniref:glycerophosphodiester phosphodiesterase family protein n=1 Tax=Mariluticola halotolerans TaxID=2909283 RepID=UPI0026E343AB|nr:glycerophosphodiester phosphodiesterase family protein [Mariluticola halotolerans]UJQ95397.1 glycerophosphodiester phosphodiesterase [Mariluticola halotolerans]
MWKKLLGVAAVIVAAIYLWNATWLAPVPDEARTLLLAHRGVHQTYDSAGLENDTCTAERIYEPTHGYIENTIPAIEAAFAAGAAVVELDVHPTTDGQFAVMHDWTLDCRTEGRGETRSHDMAYLKTLDVGYGYTADNGASYPLRGTGIGMIPSFAEVMEAFPDGAFLVNFKSREAREGDMLAEMLDANPDWQARIWGVYGGDEPTHRAKALVPGLRGYGKKDVVNCLLQYEGLGWTGFVPEACRNTLVPVPINFAGFLWGWPNRFLARMRDAGSTVILLGPANLGQLGSTGIDSVEALAGIPEGFDGYVWTNRIEAIGTAR